ncbi:MAG: hypothetical protein RIS64_1204 [Bacteroidota bacterium]|jgi:glycosyltransferase involved in cell wall biosynthesis
MVLQRKLKLTYILTHKIRWVDFEWAAQYIDRSKFELDFLILNQDDPIIDFLKENKIPFKTTCYESYDKTAEVTKFIYDHLVAHQTDIVHTHFFSGDFPGIQAAFYAKVPVRVFTTHHAGIETKRHARSKYELIFEMATDAIAISQHSVRQMIADGVPKEKITVVPYGFDLKAFEKVSIERISAMKNRYLKHHTGVVIGVAARFTEWKGIIYIVEAFKQVVKQYPDAILVLSGTHADIIQQQTTIALQTGKNLLYDPSNEYATVVQQALRALPPHNFVEIPFESDLFALFRLFDVFVHTPIGPTQETSGRVYMEAMLSKVPSVITRSGVAHDYAKHQENAWVVDYQNREQIASGILALLEDDVLRKKIIENGFKVAQNYAFEQNIIGLENVYSKLITV